MKRLRFLGAAAATSLTACGGGGVLHAVTSAVTPVTKSAAPSSQAMQLIPATAPTIDAKVLAQPIIGEAARFDGSTAPAGWLLAQGQTLKITQYPQLFLVLNTVAGGDGKTTFALPKPRFGLIVAAAGLFPASPQTLTQSTRRTDATASLGPNAIPAPLKAAKPPSAALSAQRKLADTTVRTTGGAPSAVPWQTAANYNAAALDARDAALGTLSAANRTLLDGAIQSASNGAIKLAAIVRTMVDALSDTEVAALNHTNLAYIQSFNPNWSPRPNDDARLGAASFLVSIAITRTQAKVIAAHE
jgi:microcystin-dependent protein